MVDAFSMTNALQNAGLFINAIRRYEHGDRLPDRFFRLVAKDPFRAGVPTVSPLHGHLEAPVDVKNQVWISHRSEDGLRSITSSGNACLAMREVRVCFMGYRDHRSTISTFNMSRPIVSSPVRDAIG